MIIILIFVDLHVKIQNIMTVYSTFVKLAI